MENIPSNFQQTPSLSRNPYKILFFVSLGLFLFVSSVLSIFLVAQNRLSQTISTTAVKTLITSQTNPTTADSIVPSVEVNSPDSNKTFEVGDLIFTTPYNWSLVSVGKNLEYSNEKYTYYDVKFLTDYKLYTVYALASIQINNIDQNDYMCDYRPTKTQFGQVCQLDGSGYGHFYINLDNGNNYYVSWGIESNQPEDKNYDSWRPDNNLTDDIMMNFAKSAKPATE